MAQEEYYDLIVVGAGPGGYVASVRAAQLGMKVACIEKGARLGGVCLNVGCIPSKALLDSSEYFYLARERFAEHGIRVGEPALDLPVLMARKDKIVRGLTENVRTLLDGRNVRVVRGSARLLGGGRVEVAPVDGAGEAPSVLTATNILLATGSEPVSPSALPFDGERIVSSTEALSFDAVPDHLVVVGGGAIGLELGSVWRRLGARVTVVEMLPKIAAVLDGHLSRALQRYLENQGMEFRLESRVVEADAGSGDAVRVVVETGGKREELSCDRVLVAVGRRPLTRGLGLEELGVNIEARTGHVLIDARCQTTIPGVYAIGDLVAGPMLAHKASAEGAAAVECMAGLPGEVNYDAIPSVVYTQPEAAGVGITEEQAKERGISYRTGRYPFAGAARARCLGETDGFVKILAHSKTDRVLGVHIIGPHASDILAECVLAIEMGAASEDIARTVHGHPTFGEALMEAAGAVTGISIHATRL
ncbi:MAG: dihydrolipoyl dehydrogenase [Syntrophobacteraceae bacterium]